MRPFPILFGNIFLSLFILLLLSYLASSSILSNSVILFYLLYLMKKIKDKNPSNLISYYLSKTRFFMFSHPPRKCAYPTLQMCAPASLQVCTPYPIGMYASQQPYAPLVGMRALITWICAPRKRTRPFFIGVHSLPPQACAPFPSPCAPPCRHTRS